MSTPTPTRKLTVIATSTIKSGVSAAGKAWTLYEVTAVGEDGAPIEEKLRSFDDLQGAVEVEIEKTEDPRYGVSYMLKLPRGAPGAAEPPSAGARLGPKVDELRDRVAELERQVSGLIASVTTLVERVNSSASSSATPVPAPAPPAPKPQATF